MQRLSNETRDLTLYHRVRCLISPLIMEGAMPRRSSAGSVISAHKLERAVLDIAYVHYAIAYLLVCLSAIASMSHSALIFPRENACARIAPAFSIKRSPAHKASGRLSSIDRYAGNVSQYAHRATLGTAVPSPVSPGNGYLSTQTL